MHMRLRLSRAIILGVELPVRMENADEKGRGCACAVWDAGRRGGGAHR